MSHDQIVILKFYNKIGKYLIFNGWNIKILSQFPELFNNPIAYI